jgi:hypothetical protein
MADSSCAAMAADWRFCSRFRQANPRLARQSSQNAAARRKTLETQKAARGGLKAKRCRGLALARLETRVALADHEDLAAATHDLAIAVAGFGGFERRQDFHVGNQCAEVIGSCEL